MNIQWSPSLLGFIAVIFSLNLFPCVLKAEPPFDERTFRAGFYAHAFPDFSQEDIEISVKLLSEEIGKDVGIETKVTVFSDIENMRKAFEQGEINFVAASTLNLVKDFDSNMLTDGFKLVVTSDLPDSIIVLTRQNEEVQNLQALRGHRLALVANDPVAELYINYWTQTIFNKDYKDVFKEVARERRTNQVILKLFFDQADVVCVYQNAFKLAIELNPQLSSKIQIISQLDGIPQGVGMFHKNVPSDFREKVIAESLKLTNNPRGQQLLELFKADNVMRSSFEDLVETEKLLNAYQKQKKQR
jgi:ABC-type phosphate/phosphonate transport system substrate-binding protein